MNCDNTKYRNKTTENKVLFRRYCDMKTRCLNKNSAHYMYYGGRGIKICDEWLSSFDNFADWAISNGFNETLSLDRICLDGDYCPSNCRWVPKEEQSYNKRNTIFVDYNGSKMSLGKVCKENGVSYDKVYRLIFRDCAKVEEAIKIAEQSSKNIGCVSDSAKEAMCLYCGKMFFQNNKSQKFCQSECERKYKKWKMKMTYC